MERIVTSSSVECKCAACGTQTYAIDMYGTLDEAYCRDCSMCMACRYTAPHVGHEHTFHNKKGVVCSCWCKACCRCDECVEATLASGFNYKDAVMMSAYDQWSQFTIDNEEFFNTQYPTWDANGNEVTDYINTQSFFEHVNELYDNVDDQYRAFLEFFSWAFDAAKDSHKKTTQLSGLSNAKNAYEMRWQYGADHSGRPKFTQKIAIIKLIRNIGKVYDEIVEGRIKQRETVKARIAHAKYTLAALEKELQELS